MNMFSNTLPILFSISVLINACGDKKDAVQVSDSSDSGKPANSSISYTDDIKPLLEANCLRCHSENKMGGDRNGAKIGVNFDTYSLAVANAKRANTRIQNGSMPPGGGISAEERQLFQLWLEQDTPE